MGAPRLGPFILGGLLQEGGMGQVWAAVHTDTRTPVAVKVITEDRARDPRLQRAFRHEARAVAALSHPAIVTVLDVGELPPEVEQGTDGALVPGSPYLVMELATGGSLDRCTPPATWSETRSLLLTVLDGLAHAHARGVVHCDLKPGNLLRCTEQDLRPGLKIADFGMALALGRSPELAADAGTPAFMAPEQFRGQWRSVGPWTDLYAVGCIAWQWIAGRPLFEGTRRQISRAHQRTTPGELAPRFDVPPGGEEWLRALLVKHPRARVQRAADAAAALGKLGLSDAFGGDLGTAWLPTALQPATTEVPDSELEVVADLHFGSVPEERERPPLPPPSLPDGWRRDEPTPDPVQLAGAGLELFGYRAVPMVERHEERDALWAALRRVSHTGTARAVVLRGPGGVGKSRLAAWLCHRADEVGGATWMRAGHEPKGSPSDGLPGMLSRWLSARGLTGEALRSYLRTRVPRGVAPEAVAALLMEAGQRVHGLRFTRPEDRWRLARRLLAHQARQRPVVVWLDDVQWGADAIDFVHHVLDRDEVSLLFVLTCQDDALGERPAEEEALDDLLAHPAVAALQVGPLGVEACASLVRTMLPVEGDVASRVAERAAGNPLFAVQLLGEWVQRHQVSIERGALTLADQADALADDLDALWLARLEPVLAEQPAGSMEALELAAVLGVEVTGREWKGAAAAAGRVIPPGLSAALLDAGLVTGSEGRWRFSHGLLRESLERQAAAEGRLVAHHEACAEMLADRVDRVPGALGRRARHLGAAGHTGEALPMLLEACRERVDHGDTARALTLLADHDRTVAQLELTDGARRLAEGALLRIEIKLLHEAFLDARDAARELRERAEREAWPLLRAHALRVEGLAHLHAGRVDEAAERFEVARAAYEALDDDHGQAHARCGLGDVHRIRGELAEAALHYSEALALREQADAGDRTQRQALLGLGTTRFLQGDADSAEPLLTEALQRAEAEGAPQGMVTAHTVLGEVARHRGEHVAAIQHYQRAVELDRGLGRDAVVPRLNLAVMMVLSERFDEGRAMLDALTDSGAAPDLAAPFIRCALLVCEAHQHDWRAYDAHLIEVRRALDDTGIVEPDLGRLLHVAGLAAAHAGQRRRAQVALAIALQQWRALGDDTRVQEVRRDMLRTA